MSFFVSMDVWGGVGFVWGWVIFFDFFNYYKCTHIYNKTNKNKNKNSNK